jgi:CHAD domain-containing protein
MARARAIDGLDPAEPYGEAARRILSVRSAELADQSGGVLDIADIGRVHDMRVATRRLRAALEAFEPCFPPDLWRPALDDVKQLADALGERRDRDVAIATLDRFAERMPAADRAGMASLVAELRTEQSTANETLAGAVTAEHLAALGERLGELVEAAG